VSFILETKTSGLRYRLYNEADRIRYNGQVRTSEGIATASLALDNMIRGGNIATQVLFQGGLEFNPKTLMFGAVKRAMSMTNVYKAEAVIKKRLGDQLGTNIIQGYLEAKRSRSIKNEVITRQEEFDVLDEALDNKVAELKALDANPNASEKEIDKVNRELRKLFREHQDAKKDLKDHQNYCYGQGLDERGDDRGVHLP
jgi:hypothetical protein